MVQGDRQYEKSAITETQPCTILRKQTWFETICDGFMQQLQLDGLFEDVLNDNYKCIYRNRIKITYEFMTRNLKQTIRDITVTVMQAVSEKIQVKGFWRANAELFL